MFLQTSSTVVAGPRLTKFSRTWSININWDVLLKLMNKRISQPSATVANHPGNKLGFSNREVLLYSVREWNLLVVSIRRKEIGISSISHSQIKHAVQRRCIGSYVRAFDVENKSRTAKRACIWKAISKWRKLGISLAWNTTNSLSGYRRLSYVKSNISLSAVLFYVCLDNLF